MKLIPKARYNKWFSKDEVKASIANKYIGVGSINSSSQHYADTLPPEIVNQTEGYEPSDIVYISAEGRRAKRKPIPVDLITKAASYGVQFVTDNEANRNRYYNIGERQVAELLTSLDYIATDYRQGARWKIDPKHVYYVYHPASGAPMIIYGSSALEDAMTYNDLDLINKETYEKYLQNV